jgi:hypothetical protein
MSTSSLTFPYYQGDPTIFNKVHYPHLETTNSFEGIIILHPSLFCFSFKQCERGCGITRTNLIWRNCSVTHPPFIWGNCNLQFTLLLNWPMLNFNENEKLNWLSVDQFNKGGKYKLQGGHYNFFKWNLFL